MSSSTEGPVSIVSAIYAFVENNVEINKDKMHVSRQILWLRFAEALSLAFWHKPR